MSAQTCALCPKPGEKRIATVEAWVVMPRWLYAAHSREFHGRTEHRDRADRLQLCAECYDATKKRGDLVPGAEVGVL